MPNKQLLGKITSKIQKITLNKTENYSVVITNLAESQSCKETINDTQRNIGI